MDPALQPVENGKPEPGQGRPAQFTRRLGDRLLAAGLITMEQLQQALEVQQRTRGFLGQILVDLGFVSAAAIGNMLAGDLGVTYVDLLQMQPDPEAVKLLPENIVRSTQAIPLRVRGDVIEVAMADPLNIDAIDTIHLHTGLRVIPYLCMVWELQRAINEHFDAQARTIAALQEIEADTPQEAPGRGARADIAAASEAPIVRLVDSLLESALALRASDIHFEPQEKGLRVRFRVDGALLEHAVIPRTQMAAVTARIKVLCVMDITESRRPQDGRMSYSDHGRVYDLRASSVPTVYGEKIVLRILDKAAVLMPLSKLGFLPEQQSRFEALVRQPHGMVLVVGPTGSGKSTTLYSAMNLLNDSRRNIMTLEDPVEYYIPGLNQVQINARIGLTFASGLRTFVRQDPDVILVGEIRDTETAQMAVQASLTGHLVLSTLHTNSAVGTISRLANLGVDRFLIAQALSGVVSQRLAARVCTHCAETYRPDPETLRAVGIQLAEAATITFRRGRGCHTCHQRGYLGRVGLYEVLVVDEDIRRLILRQAPEAELQAAAEANRMLSLREAALHAVRAGLTTPEEMGRVVLTVGGE
ncbi:MAG: ATPase, T2SS/T4P/T4SS family [Chloroherpetonaceae bacterium]|nr:ATPase, T2SS/T4P/T4SS family [Chthonomonadaceae bacterium]MDW8206797.1 ATPase, T2SS/T4P/T4SS family [Chloroherpetonaceae bacterium]